MELDVGCVEVASGGGSTRIFSRTGDSGDVPPRALWDPWQQAAGRRAHLMPNGLIITVVWFARSVTEPRTQK